MVSSLDLRASSFAKTNLLNTHTLLALLVLLDLIHVQYQHITLHIHEHKTRHHLVVAISIHLAALLVPTRRARRAARVYEELALHLVRLEPRRAAPAQHIDIHLPRRDE